MSILVFKICLFVLISNLIFTCSWRVSVRFRIAEFCSDVLCSAGVFKDEIRVVSLIVTAKAFCTLTKLVLGADSCPLSLKLIIKK